MKTNDFPWIYFDFVYSLPGGNRNDMTINCANPPLRNGQLPGNVVPIPVCA